MIHSARPLGLPSRGAGAARQRASRPAVTAGRLLALALLLALPACTTPRPAVEPAGPSAAATPRWVGKPLTWGKLEEIERWLAEHGPDADPFWRLEGELELAEGRLLFARTDQGQGRVASERLAARLSAAREGFQRVAGDPRASDPQRRRARTRLDELESARPVPEAPVPSGPPRGDFLTRAAWGARPPLAARLDPVGGPWQRITVHHSDEVPGVRLDGSLASSREALLKIQRYHQENLGWADIGYHFLVDPEGRVFEGRPLRWQGAHVGGQNNVQNLGVCVLGNFHDHLPSQRALASLEKLLDELCSAHGIPRRAVTVHREYKDTICPGDRLTSWVDGYSGKRSTPRSAPQASNASPRASQRAPLPRPTAHAVVH